MISTSEHHLRLHAAIRGEPCDQPAFLCPGGMMNMAVTDAMTSDAEWPNAHTSAAQMAALALRAHDLTGLDNVGLPFCMTIEAEGLGARVTLGSHETEPRVTSYVLDGLDDLDRLKRFDAEAGRAAVAVKAVAKLASDPGSPPLVVCLTGPVSLATSLVEPMTFYRALRRAPAKAHALLELCCDALLTFGDALAAAGADAVCIADPSATGELLGRQAFRDFAAPYIDEVTRRLEARDCPTIVHVCGDATCLGETLEELRAPVISVDTIVRLRALRLAAPSKVLMGNLSTSLLEFGSPEKVAEAARTCVKRGAGIVAPACGIGARTPAANLRAAADALSLKS